MITPYRIIPINNIIRKCDLDENGFIKDVTFLLYDNDVIDNIMSFTFLNVLFITPRFKYLVGYELINIKNTLLKLFGDDVVFYECTDSEMSSIIKNCLQRITFKSLIIRLYQTDVSPTKDSIIHSIEDLNNERKIINTIIYFLQNYHKIYGYNPIKNTELSYGIIENNKPITNEYFANEIRAVLIELNYETSVNINDIITYFVDNNIVQRFIIDYYIDTSNNLHIVLPEKVIVISKDSFHIT